jgi:outer membrane autotransporter protein
MAAPSVGRNGGDVEFTSGGVWAQGLFNKSKQNDAFNGYTRGIALGMDGTINKDWTIGAGYSFSHSDISGTSRNTEIDSNTVFVYGQYKPTQWYVNAIANYTMSDYSERGTILDGVVVTGDYDVNSFGGALAAGYDFANGITPELGLRYMHVNANDYANSYGINTHIDDTDFLTGVIGAKYVFNVVATRHLTLVPQLNAGVKYDLLSDKNTATVAMPGVNAYTIDGNRLKRIGGEFGIGLGMQYRDLELSVNYDIDVREDYTSQTGMLKFRYNF